MARRSRAFGLFALPILAAGCAVATDGADNEGAGPPETIDAADVTAAAVHETWFVELTEPPLARGGDPILLSAEKARFRADARAARLPVVERYAFNHLWNGVSLHVEHRSAALLATLPGVRAIYPVVPIVLDKQYPPTLTDSAAHASHDVSVPDLASAISMTGADVAQNSLGLTGAKVRVGVIDSGIDIHHPDLGGNASGCFGPGCRVAFGYDFVGDNYDASVGSTLPEPDAIPDDCGGHGTHVAGIIGANGAVKGVAPNVIFGAYRVFGCNGSTDADVMIKAMEMAESDGMRVVNMSIGSSFQWPDYPTAKAADQLVADGVVVVCSIGNSGAANGLGPVWAAGAPGVGKDVIGTASVDNTMVTQPAFTVSASLKKYGFVGATGAPPPPLSGSFPLARTGDATTVGDGCVNAPAAGSLTGKVVLIRRGSPAAPAPTCGFYTKALNAMNAGAVGVVLYNNVVGALSPTVAGSPAITIPVAAISKADGEELDALLAAGPVTFDWTALTVSTANPTAGTISSFSSWGLPPNLSFKPDLAAPGGSIYSTYPLELGAYASLSGTSMASPHTAGAAALLLEARPEIPAKLVRDVLQNTAVPVAWSGDAGGGTSDPIARQGAGLIHIDAAVQAQVIVSPGRIALGESTAAPATQKLTLTNEGAAAITYDLSHVPGATAAGSPWTPSVTGTGFATVSFGAPSVTVPAGGSATVDVTITADAAAADGSLYGGHVVLTPQGGGTTLRVPYAGYKGDYQAIQMLTPVAGKGYPWLARPSGSTFTNLPSGATFTLQAGDVPYVVIHLDHGARRIKIDAYDAVKNKPYGNVLDTEYYGQAGSTTGTSSFSWDGTTVFNKQLYKVPNGTYVLKLSALKALGDAANPAHWETWTSPVITINHP
ncbi:MAG: S8 family serine peptidase [Minicystis sp.]